MEREAVTGSKIEKEAKTWNVSGTWRRKGPRTVIAIIETGIWIVVMMINTKVEAMTGKTIKVIFGFSAPTPTSTSVFSCG